MSGVVEFDEVSISSGASSFAATLASANMPKLPMTSMKTEAVIQFVVRPAYLILPVVILVTRFFVNACACYFHRVPCDS